MRHVPLFVPHDGEHLSAIAVLPDGLIAGVAIFPMRTPQVGVAANVFWARAATELAARSVASIRFEPRGSGDSTGTLRPALAEIADPIRETLTVAAFAMEALDLPSFMTAGSCYNAAIALEAARDPRCEACVAVDPPSADPGSLGRLRRIGAEWPLVDAVRTRPALRRVLLYDTVRRLLRDGMGAEVHEALESSAEHARVLLIEDKQLETRGMAEDPAGYAVVDDLTFTMIRVDAVELDEAEERVLGLVVEWLVDQAGTGRAAPGTFAAEYR
ncbi:MAG TPA: hypothetical protein VH063_11390 [Gaiellaceae bacterium]|jgi:hypothetical protein|nr:hypothetical protein [Gaiellaceae bacterium]